MNRRVFAMSAAVALSCAPDRRPRLNVYNWSSYIDPDMLSRFERERGVRIRYGTFESNEEMLAKIAAGNSGWDIVFPTHSRLAPMRARGLLAPLDHRRLHGLGNLDPAFRNAPWDPELRFGIPYLWNATGICCNAKAAAVPRSWNGLWDPSLAGRMTMLDDPEDVLGTCLLKLGFPFDSADVRELQAASGEAVRQKKLLRAYINAEVRDQLVSGDVLAAQLWSTTSSQAIRSATEAAPLSFVYPSEGFPLYCDCAAILAESERGPLAHEFLSFLLAADVAAANARVADSATPNAAARGLLSPDAVLYPPAEVQARGHWPVAPSPESSRYRDRLWTEIKAS